MADHSSTYTLALAALALPESGAPSQAIIGTQGGVTVVGTASNDELSYTPYWPPATLAGGQGDDTYRIDTIFQTIFEAAGGGIDTAVSSILSYTLPDEVENLAVLADRGYGAGNALGNRITGSDASQILNGGGGNDLLTGGAGYDIFQMLAGGGWDVITDFETGIDRLHLAAFAGFDTAAAVLAGLRQDGAHVLLDLGDGQGVTFLNRQVGDFTAADFMLPPNPAEMTLSFAAEFDSFISSPDGSQGWRTTHAKGLRTLSSNAEHQYYTDASVGRDPFRIEEGALVVTAMPEQNQLGLPYTSGIITTQGMFAQRYGYFEARMLLPAGQGFWPAFWLLPANGTWPPELDIMENFGRGDGTLTFANQGVLGGQRGSYSLSLPFDSIAASYHTFAASWLPDGIRYYVDGVEVASTPTLPGLDVPMYMLLNLAVSNAGLAAGTTAEMRIDHVRAYAYSEATIAAHAAAPDRLTSEVSATLPDAMHELVLTGTGPLTGTGNALDNSLIAGPGDTALYGLAGVDLLFGGGGNDTLDGGTGADRMVGGAGDDTYVVDNTGDRVTELPGQGTDTVRSSINYTLGNNLEFLILTGAATAGMGNALDNLLSAAAATTAMRLQGLGGDDTLLGGSGNDYLDGGTGRDLMTGGLGNDTYVVDNPGDRIVELPGEGIDVVRSSIAYTLGDNLERLVLTGTAGLAGTGNALANSLFGSSGNDTLSGGAGNDTLSGGAGRDIAGFGGTRAQTVLTRNANGSWTATGPDGTDQLTGMEVARFADGDVPLRAVPRDFTGSGNSGILFRASDGGVAEWQMNGFAYVGGGSLWNPGLAWTIAGTGDFDGDTRADILWRHADGHIALWQMNGTAAIGGGGLGQVGADWSIAGIADFNGDGRADILWRNADGTLSQWWMKGTASLGGGSFATVDAGWQVASLADFDGDGKADILWRHADGSVAMWLMDGTTGRGGGTLWSPGTDWSIAGTGDFNGDGRADILWRGADGSLVEWWMDGTLYIGGGTVGVVARDWRVAQLGDFNADGRSDILWQNDNGGLSLWEMNGTAVLAAGSLYNPGSSWLVV